MTQSITGLCRAFRRQMTACLSAAALLGVTLPAVYAKDYFLTLGGGYSPQGNQASLEANVLFFQDVLAEKHPSRFAHSIFFADGFNKRADLQVLAPQGSDRPATDLLNSIFSSRGSGQNVAYRNHRVPNISGPLSPEQIEESLADIAGRLATGDRLFVYVTAHGSQAKGRNKFNTTIDCWNDRSINAREFAGWLDAVPDDVPTIMVMAQCFCGGFSHSIFDDSDAGRGLSKKIRVGFFAQQHDLAAAGCRPDISNDAEYSSYFWGALAGRSRTGKPIVEADYDSNGRVSFAEAHAFTLINSQTIDIPLRTTEALLRVASRIEGYDHRREVTEDESEAATDDSTSSGIEGLTRLQSMQGSIDEIASLARPDWQVAIVQLSHQLGLDISQDVTEVFTRYDDARNARRGESRSRGRGRRGRSSGRRQLMSEITDAWPELKDRDTWRNSELLRKSNQALMAEQIQALPAYESFRQAGEDRQAARDSAQEAELREVKFQRLVNCLELVILAENLPLVAAPEVVQRYQQMLEVEESFLELN